MEECASGSATIVTTTQTRCLDSEGSSASSVSSRRLAPRWRRAHADDVPARRLARE
jgi:hypothetical protein